MSGEGERGFRPGHERVSREDVARIASLARLRPGPETVDQLVRDLNRVLEHVAALERADVELGGERAEPDIREARYRDPELSPDPLHRSAADLAPDWREGFFVVPRLPALEGDAEEGA